jgi:four helix bundle protein
MDKDASGRWTAEDLDVFKRGFAISIEVHKVSLDFPKIEQFGGLADQMRRASRSVCALIVEGSGRQASKVEFRRYLVMALGSADEMKLWCLYAERLGYISVGQAQSWRTEYSEIARMLQSFARRLS